MNSARLTKAAFRLQQISHHFKTQRFMSTSAAQKLEVEEEVYSQSILGARILTMNRIKALGALNTNMVNVMTPQLQAWNNSDQCKVIILQSASSPKAFCAGGDVRAIIEGGKGNKAAIEFFEGEYRLNHLIGTLKKPFVSILDGITMGGGVGLSVHAPFRVATENTLFAMPETAIGLFPDVGGSFFLPRLDGETGVFLGLTGHRLKGLDTMFAGIATHYVPSVRLPALKERLIQIDEGGPKAINQAIEEFAGEIPKGYQYTLSQHRDVIDKCFRFNTVEEIVDALRAENTDWCTSVANKMMTMSPTSLKVTLKQIRKGKNLDFISCFRMERGLSKCFSETDDFFTGVDSLLVSKTNNPKWNPPTLKEVSMEHIENFYFAEVNSKNFQLLSDITYQQYPENYALPTEEEIKSVITGSNLQMSVQEVVDHFMWGWDRHKHKGEELSSVKVGSKEKILDVLQRKCEVSQDKYVTWKE